MISPHETLPELARETLHEVQASLAAIIAALRIPERRSRELARRLKLHPTLAWKVLRIATTHNLFADVQYLPGDTGVEIFLAACAERGVAGSLIARVRAALANFKSLVETHAGDRTSLEQMLVGMSDNAAVQADSRPFRRAAFRCASSTWGMQVRMRLLSKILHPSEGGRLMDIALVHGFIGMRRIRPGAPLPLARVVVLDNDGKARLIPESRPIDPEGVRAGVPMLRKFCSEPCPEVRIAMSPEGVLEQQLGKAPIGERAAATVFSGEVQFRAASRFRDEHNTESNTAVSVRTPIETLVLDVWAHHSLFGSVHPEAALYGEVCGTPWYLQPPQSADRLPMAESVRALGVGLARSRLTEAPSYVEVMRTTFQHLGWDAEEFMLHRLRVEYPVIATAVVMRFPLPIESVGS
jgi:hypothetical protein